MQVVKDALASGIEIIADKINLMRGIDSKLNRPLKDLSIVELVAVADQHVDMIRSRDISAMQYMGLMVQELFYRGTDTHGGTVLSPSVKGRILSPDPEIIKMITEAGLEISTIDSCAAFGWKVVHPKSGFLAHLTYPVR